MVSKVKIIKTVAALENGLNYIGNQNHPDHADIEIGPEVRFGIDPAISTEGFCKGWLKEIAEDNAVIRRGRRRSRFSVCEIIRSPDGANMTAEEEMIFLQGIQQAQGGAAVARRHRNKITGAVDFHVYRFRKWDREENPLLKLRIAADAAHDELNAARSLAGGKHIETMVEVRRRKGKERGVKELAEQLQEMPGLTVDNLKKTVEVLGHTVTRYNPNADTISVQHPNSKRAHRYSISGLFARIAELNRGTSVPVQDMSPPMMTEPPQNVMPVSTPAALPTIAAVPTKKRDLDMDV